MLILFECTLLVFLKLNKFQMIYVVYPKYCYNKNIDH